MDTTKIIQFLGTQVKYVQDGTQIYAIDADGGMQLILDLRGWGAIQNMFKHGGNYDFMAAEKFQDDLGEFIAEAIKEKVEREKDKILNPNQVEPRPAVKWFAQEMEKKLRTNDHKGGWINCDLQYLSMRLTQERKELYGAIENRQKGSFFGTTHTDNEIIGECADIANFSMMIADRYGKDFGK